MTFPETWRKLQANLKPGTSIRNWTVDNGYRGDTFVVTAISDAQIEVDAPQAKNRQKIQKRDFEVVHSLWAGYCAGTIARPKIRDVTRFSKYIISILHHLS